MVNPSKSTICMTVTMRWTKSTVMVSFTGSQEINTKAITIKMSDKDMVLWSGVTVVVTLATGKMEYSTALVSCSFKMDPRELASLNIIYFQFH